MKRIQTLAGKVFERNVMNSRKIIQIRNEGVQRRDDNHLEPIFKQNVQNIPSEIVNIPR